MKKIKKVRYSGVLAKPMVLQKTYSGLLSSPEQDEKNKKKDEEANRSQFGERLLALFKHYGIDPLREGADIRLAAALASDHVPGFQRIDGSAPRAGRHSKWQGDKSLELLADVWALEAKGHTASAACRTLAANSQYGEPGKKIAHRTLYRRYQEALKNCNPLMARVILAAKKDGAPYRDIVIHSWATDEGARKDAKARLEKIHADLLGGN